MKVILRTTDVTASGRAIVRERELTGDEITIGRATTNAIVLADLAVEQHHATLAPAPSGRRLTMRAETKHAFLFEGAKRHEVSFDPATGGEFVFGTYRLVLAPAADAADETRLICNVTREERREGARDAVRAFALASALPGKRGMAWLALAGILLAFLAIPVWSHLNRPAIEPGARAPDGVMWDASWSPGKLSDAHHALEDNCEACHVEPFVSVRDETCLACHQDVADHAAHPRLTQARGPMSRFDAFQWRIASAFGKEGPEACVTCHSEHEGAGRMEPTAQQFCADCHATLDRRLTDTSLGNAGDFTRQHPQFQPAVFTTLGSDATRRISLAARPREASGLKFNHDAHLDPRGGVARMARSLGQYRAPLQCSDCHRPSPNGVGFEPIVMEDDCESCHSLVYDKVGATFRTLRHGDVAQMRADLLALDRAPRSAIATARRRPGSVGNASGAAYPDFGPPVRDYTSVARALAPGGVCGECHYPAATAQGPGVMPVNLQARYFTKGRFEHEDHRQEPCASCHKASTSNAAADLLLPGIATCRECHGGERDAAADVPSGCAMCHSYHLPGGWTPARKPPPGHPRKPPAQIARISREAG
jgi:hypothetical protein